jgi:hypothetical protein
MVRKSGSGKSSMITWNGAGQPSISHAKHHILVNVKWSTGQIAVLDLNMDCLDNPVV